MSAKILIIGLPLSCRTTLAKALAHKFEWEYIDASLCLKEDCRPQLTKESAQQYADEYQQFISRRLTTDPRLVIKAVRRAGKCLSAIDALVVDGLSSPKDFAELFDYRTDTVIFLNRQDDDHSDAKDHENIGVSVIRDYCFWLSSIGLIDRGRWLEYNFRISDPDFRDPNKPPLQKPKPQSDEQFVKEMGARNSIFIARSMNRVISHAIEKLGRQ